MKIINKIPSSTDMLDKEVDKLFNTKLNKFLGYAFPLFCGIAWLCILLAIFSS